MKDVEPPLTWLTLVAGVKMRPAVESEKKKQNKKEIDDWYVLI